MKKFLAIFMAALMAVSCSVAASAATVEESSSATTNIYYKTRHNGFELVEIIVNGCQKDAGTEKYTIVDPDNFTISFKMLQDLKKLPLKGNEKVKQIVSSGLNFGTLYPNEIVKEGAYSILVCYSNGTSEKRIFETDIFKDVTKGETRLFNFTNSIDTDLKIKSIEITIIYTIKTDGGNGWFGQTLWWDHTDWRCDLVLQFN